MDLKSNKQNQVQYPNIVYRDQLITLNDLLQFKQELLFEFKQIVKEITGRPAKQWLKSHEVQKLLGILFLLIPYKPSVIIGQFPLQK